MKQYSVGLDVGAETVKLVALVGSGARCEVAVRRQEPHHKEPAAVVRQLLEELGTECIAGIAVTGRLRHAVAAEAVPTKAALRHGVRIAHPELEELTVISIGAHGFAVLEIHAGGQDWYQPNSRCSQGTGNFLNQLVQRFGMSIEEASALCESEARPAALSGRCPVILKTDMTHLANKGEDRSRILAGLYDAVSENVLTLVRPRLAPSSFVLVGGVTRSLRIRNQIGGWLEQRGLSLLPPTENDAYVEAIGAAFHALEHGGTRLGAEGFDSLVPRRSQGKLERVPALRDALARVRRMPKQPIEWHSDTVRPCVLGLDIGSTGSKAVALDLASGSQVWESYLNTEGAPVRAAQQLVERWVAESQDRASLAGIGVTGSGREVVGSLLRTCYGGDRVFILNEIAAHARGAAEIDPKVDTIFEIGGQDAKYIRLEEGRVIDAAMNEACSAGTGSFIAEQGTKFEGIGNDPRKLGQVALEAQHGVSLGQHCSVFMAEVIDEAITQGEPRDAIIAGLFDSVIQNYLNRVKGTRTVGERIFCQGMPFSSDALAAAVARQTGREVVVPPNPGTIGALGIGLLVRDELGERLREAEPLLGSRFLAAEVIAKETIVCRSTKGCGGAGNRCRIDRLSTLVDGQQQRFLWGGNCSLYDRGAGRAKLPDLAPDPFRDREALLDQLLEEGAAECKTVALSDEFALKQLAPLFVVFLQHLGLRCDVVRRPGSAALRTGIEGARIPYCAPVQLIHGVYFDLAGRGADYILLPMVKELPRAGDEEYSTLCPMVLAIPELIENLLPEGSGKLLKPVIEFDAEGYAGEALRAGMRELAHSVGELDRFEAAFTAAVEAQTWFDAECMALGRHALEFCSEHSVVPVAVLGRPYTIHNDVLNSNVPSILRSLGALPIPVDCLPVSEDVPTFGQQYWAHTQRNLRAADYVRRTPGLYSVFCSNYACGPDSFTLHFYSYVMQGKPLAVVETDGHSGDAGTKTRMEAFLYCVDTDLKTLNSSQAPRNDLKRTEDKHTTWNETRARNARVFLPRMGPQAEIAAAAMRGEGFRAQSLPLSGRDDVRTGRRYTSGKECLPMILTLGTLLNALDKLPKDERVSFLMPTAHGPCRFGVYNVLHKIALERAGYGDRVEIVIPDDADYFEGMSPEFSAKLWLGFAAHDLLQQMLFDCRPVERRPGSANELHTRFIAELSQCMERPPVGSSWGIARELMGGMWGVRALIARAAKAFAAIKDFERRLPTVGVVGEIYVRMDPFANDFVVDKLEERGIRVRFAPFIEWLEYSNYLASERLAQGKGGSTDEPLTVGLTALIQKVTLDVLYPYCAKQLAWPRRPEVPEVVAASLPYVHPGLTGEAALTIGGPLHEFQQGLIEGVVIVGPHECMPCKISEAQYGAVNERVGIPYLSVALNGEPLDTELLDRFTYDIHELVRRRATHAGLSLMPELDSTTGRAPESCAPRDGHHLERSPAPQTPS